MISPLNDMSKVDLKTNSKELDNLIFQVSTMYKDLIIIKQEVEKRRLYLVRVK